MRRAAAAAVSLISILLVVGAILPALARASETSGSVTGTVKSTGSKGNLQTMAFLQPAYNLDPSPATGGGDVTIVDNSALVSVEGPDGTLADIEKPTNGTISTYIVQPGDTLTGIAQLFGVTTGTILSANDLSRTSVLQPGEQLVILPITGIQYTVKKGDTIESIAKAFDGDVTEIESFNNVDDSSISVGQQIIIPNGEASASPALASSKSSGSVTTPPKKSASTKVLTGSAGSCGTVIPDAHNPAEPSHNVGPVGTCAEDAYYIAPLTHYVQTQGIHGYNAVDLAASIGTPIMAAADGTVIVARSGGWNGGYGSYVVIQHGNGSQTLYGHMSKVAAYDGETVVQGQVIGYVGESGDATGPHVHFEIRDGIRNPF
jgi:murein DD-endopeptidase MepM/ murein hydrolase activator NlpD